MVKTSENFRSAKPRVASKEVARALATALALATPTMAQAQSTPVEPPAIVRPLQPSVTLESKKEANVYLEKYREWAKDSGGMTYFDDFIKFYNLELSQLAIPLRQEIILTFLTTVDQYGSGVYWSYVTNGDYKKIEELYSDRKKMFADLIKTEKGSDFIFQRVVGQDQTGEVRSGTFLEDKDSLKEFAPQIFEYSINNARKLIEVRHKQFEEMNLLFQLETFFPALDQSQQNKLRDKIKQEHIDADITTVMHLNNAVLNYLGISADGDNYKLGLVKEKFSNVNNANFDEFKKMMEEIRNGIFKGSNKPEGEKHRHELQVNVYKEALKVLARGRLLSGTLEGSYFKFDDTIKTGNSMYNIGEAMRVHESRQTWMNNIKDEEMEDLEKMISSAIASEIIGLLPISLSTLDQFGIKNMLEIAERHQKKSETKNILSNQEILKIVEKGEEPLFKAAFLVDLKTFATDERFINSQIESLIRSTMLSSPIDTISMLQVLSIKEKDFNKYKKYFEELLKQPASKWLNIAKTEVEIFKRFQNNPDLLYALIKVSMIPKGYNPNGQQDKDFIHKTTLQNILARLEGGFDYIISETYRLNKGVIPESGLIDYLQQKKYPHRSVVYLNILIRKNAGQMYPDSGIYNEKSAKLWWTVLGKKYDQTRSYQPSGLWSLNNNLFYRYDARSTSVDMRTLDINNPSFYLDIFKRVNQVGNGTLWKEMVNTLDFSKFDEHAKAQITSNKLVELSDEIVKFGNQIDPEITKILMRRIVEKNKSGIEEMLLKWGFSKYSGSLAGHEFTIDGLDALRKIETLLSLKFNSESQTGIQEDKKLNIELTVKLTFNLEFMDKKINLDGLMDIYSRFATLDSWSFGGKGLIKFEGDAIREALKILSDKMVEVVTKNGEGIQDIKPDNLEKIRATLNKSSRNSGNEFVNNLFSKFMDSNPNTEDLLKIVINFHDLVKTGKIDRDVEQTYKQMTNFAFSLLLDRLATDKGINKSEFVRSLTERGFVIDEPESNTSKAISRLATGQTTVGQVASKAIGKVFGSAEVGIGPIYKATFEAGMREGANAEYICTAGICTKENAEAMLLTFDQDKIAANLEVNRQGVVNTAEVKGKLRDKYIASGPIAFSAGGRLILDLAYSNGEQVGSHVKIDGRDGFIVTNQDGKIIILNKRNMDLNEFKKLSINISQDDLDTVAGKDFNPVKVWAHKLLLDKIMRSNKLNAVTNMLLAEDGKQTGTPLADGADSRRLFLKMKDGRMGIITSIKNMSTDKLVKIALSADAQEVIYMDTGMYDSYEVVTADMKTHSLGHKDTDASTQRLFLNYRN